MQEPVVCADLDRAPGRARRLKGLCPIGISDPAQTL